MISELKKCPFCGSEKDMYSMPREMLISEGVSTNVGWSCICAHCDAHVWGNKQEDTEAKYNTRPIEDALQARIDELVDALIWCSGSPDFCPGGQAREGWVKLCQPLLNDESKEKENE
jgi:hypothetical protein